MYTEIHIGDFAVDVMLKNIKNIHLSVYPPTGRVRISAPLHMNLDTIRVYAIQKLPWIKKHQSKFIQQARETPREYIDLESHYFWGRRYLLKVIEKNSPHSISVKHRELILQVRPNTSHKQREFILDAWYRENLKGTALAIIQKWEKLMHVKVNQFYVQKMKTKWGSCNPVLANIRLNSELAKKPIDFLEYIIVHEMTHLIEPTHNDRFLKLMAQNIPNWQSIRDELNRLPVRSEIWTY